MECKSSKIVSSLMLAIQDWLQTFQDCSCRFIVLFFYGYAAWGRRSHDSWTNLILIQTAWPAGSSSVSLRAVCVCVCCEVWMRNHELDLWSANCELRTLMVSDELLVVTFALRIVNLELWIVNCGLTATHSDLSCASCELEITHCELLTRAKTDILKCSRNTTH